MMEGASREPEEQAYIANLDYTLKELQSKVQQHEDELERLRSEDHGLPQTPAAQAKIVKAAFKEVTETDPFLPPPSSILPALLALRRTHRTIVESKAFLASQDAAIDREKRQFESDQANLRDQNLLTEALNARIDSLRAELDSNADMRPEDGARQRREELQKMKTNYEADGRRIYSSLRDFIEQRLAVLLAAEELGGPVVGDLMDVEAEDIAAGFNAQGKLKKPKDGANSDKRQRRIDEMLGNREPSSGDDGHVVETGQGMKDLVQELAQQLKKANGDNASSYVELSRDSAAGRFLVRSKVAQFHPKDAMKMRLIDFGRELES